LTLVVAFSAAAGPAAAQSGEEPSPPQGSEAQPPAPPPPSAHEYGEALATELFTTGRDMMAEGRYAEACPKLAESARLAPRVGTLGKLAECEERLGQLVRSRTHWQQALNLARVERDDRLRLAEQEFRRIDRIVPKVKIVGQGSLPADIKLRIDDLELRANSVGVPIPLDPGRHTVSVTAAGKKPWTSSLHLLPNGAVTLVSVPPLASEGAAAAPEGPPVAAPGPPSGPLRTVGFVTGGLAAASLALGAYYGVTARSKLELSNARGCVGSVCTPQGAEARNEARQAGDFSTAFFIVGGVLAAGAVTLVLIGSDDGAQPNARASVSAQRGSGLRVRGSLGAFMVEGSF
jgi:hypothetical protein